MSRWREGAPFKVGLSGFREWQPEKPKEKTAEKGAAAETAAQKEVREAAAAQAEQNSQTAAQEMAQRKQGGAAPVQSEQNSRMAAKGMAQDVPSGSGMETAAAGEEMEAIHATELPMRNLFPEYDWNAVWEELCREHKPAALFEEWDTQCIQLELKDLRSLPKNTGIWETTAFCYMDFQLSVSGAWQDGGGTVVPWRAGSISETGARDGGYFRFPGILCRRPRG